MPEEDALLEQANQARSNAYAPYSGFPVGAAVCAIDGRIFSGCNVENGSYGLTVCAERNAIAAAVAAGAREFQSIAIIAGGDEPATPCGACRQVLAEFSPNLSIILSDPQGQNIRRLNLDDLLPERFTL